MHSIPLAIGWNGYSMDMQAPSTFFLCIPSPSLLCPGRFECKLCDTLHHFRSTTFPSVLHTDLMTPSRGRSIVLNFTLISFRLPAFHVL
ncbi:hypothetical protein H113_05905 [Trichophyton rubrum MR1459]|uniref:Uncharacterized protein n=2 Tax=Trichophyton TaxID=5550 RepID=A0A022VXK8_TRIRU|nr:hypothetical protein H100_05867 [Trichophyton rubrum MR850]EZF40143.1 hypothetical protein H102_05836 [Trichophyton rubrum CBS 100081]EZF50776.1 hypothetical protein H103_05864 [Trichophyton rubrum CBS 288.86]EZF72034.1 hypothetical protein H105_05877 [Trichophyton soudanense CBS 452.61]EZF82688.1 hypothetical protein H110_05858 [Trichophyton rubrum MR1448]EZF93382.1 hypothetical protein H113_05905 [Trichophyton rubrum MR1459]EZG04838.1 hypothetical protein H106_05702 [Trichophyton rubrum 